jgi:cyanophycin synthetase
MKDPGRRPQADLSLPTRLLARAGPRRPGVASAVRLNAVRARGVRSTLRQRAFFRDAVPRLEEARRITYRRIWTDAAGRVGAGLVDLGDDFLLMHKNGRETVVRQNRVTLNDAVGMELSRDKVLVNRLLSEAGLRVPRRTEVDASDPALALPFFSEAKPCVVKPASGTAGGGGVTGGVQTDDDLWRVCMDLSRWIDKVVVEETVAGTEYRLTFLDGELLDAVERRPPSVVGDGISTVDELVQLENRRRIDSSQHDELRVLRIDFDMMLTLKHAGLSLQTVPGPGQRVQVKTAVSENARAENSTVSNLSAGLIRDAARATRLAHVRLAGVDLVANETSDSLQGDDGAILEVNSPTGLHYHYLVADAEAATPIAVPILERLLEQ